MFCTTSLWVLRPAKVATLGTRESALCGSHRPGPGRRRSPLMRQRLLWCALAALGAAAPPAPAADLILTGTVTAGTYTRTNEDIYIYDATIAPGAGGTTTLTLVAHNGKIVVGSAPGIPGNWGID